MAKKLYDVHWHLSGASKKDVFAGDTITLDDEVAAPLVAGGVITPRDGVAPEAPKPPVDDLTA